ncbi:hypothetical protein RHMOL_Rhmol10G0172400 [Rhododendron molle]|uniref:Uncharacterized protein n=1 Tax=Rhododendron molle TaxID=49168 RepID=A0ACC0M3G8_RHOML|nr:hypothetical protein RHMOL_Rhmol10G0172400 [Rhododendron molle]
MDDSRLAARVESLEAEMAFYRGEIEELNTNRAAYHDDSLSPPCSVQLIGLLLRPVGQQG